MTRDETYAEVVAEIERLDGRIDGVRPAKGGHRLIYWTTRNGAKKTTTIPAYAGNWRARHYARTDIRRAART